MKTAEFLDELKSKLGCPSDSELAVRVRLSPGRISQLRNGQSELTAGDVAKLVKRVSEAHASDALRSSIRPIVEFFPIEISSVRDNGRLIPFDVASKSGKALASVLKSCSGLYSYYNSQAEVIHFGKTERNDLYSQMINTFNRELTNNKMFRVAHPWGRYKSNDGDELRKIKKVQVNLPDIAGYFSSYQVAEDLIGLLEALIIRLVPKFDGEVIPSKE